MGGGKRKAGDDLTGPDGRVDLASDLARQGCQLLDSPPYSGRTSCGVSAGRSSGEETPTPGMPTSTLAAPEEGLNTESHGAFSPLQEGVPSLLPFEIDSDHGLPHVTPEVTARVLQQCAAGTMRAHVIDCRFPHEYEGGHVRGAVNLYDPADLQRYLVRLLREDQDRAHYLLQHALAGGEGRGGGGGMDGGRAGSASGLSTSAAVGGDDGMAALMHLQNSVFIFYCDYSSERAPRMWRHVRNLDRRDHMMDYPALSFPHMYVLHGGYAGFLTQQGASGWCTHAQHVRVDDNRWLAELRGIASEQRAAWRVARMSRGVGHIPADEAGAAGGTGGGCGGYHQMLMTEESWEPQECFDDEMTEVW